jgi:hypothetical protein
MQHDPKGAQLEYLIRPAQQSPMKSRLAGASVVFFAAALGLAVASLAFTGRSTLFVEGATYRFGRSPPRVIKHSFKVVNYLDEDVELFEIFKTCGCAKAVLERPKLKSGDSTWLHCEFDLRGRSGEYNTSVTAIFRDSRGNQRPLDCNITGTVDPVIEVTASQLVFGIGHPNEQEVGIKIAEPGTRIESVTANHSAFSAGFLMTSDRLRIVFDPSKWHEGATGFATLRIKTNHDFEKVIPIRLAVYKPIGGSPQTD